MVPRCIGDRGVLEYWQDMSVACVWTGNGYWGEYSTGMMGRMTSPCSKVACVILFQITALAFLFEMHQLLYSITWMLFSMVSLFIVTQMGDNEDTTPSYEKAIAKTKFTSFQQELEETLASWRDRQSTNVLCAGNIHPDSDDDPLSTFLKKRKDEQRSKSLKSRDVLYNSEITFDFPLSDEDEDEKEHKINFLKSRRTSGKDSEKLPGSVAVLKTGVVEPIAGVKQEHESVPDMSSRHKGNPEIGVAPELTQEPVTETDKAVELDFNTVEPNTMESGHDEMLAGLLEGESAITCRNENEGLLLQQQRDFKETFSSSLPQGGCTASEKHPDSSSVVQVDNSNGQTTTPITAPCAHPSVQSTGLIENEVNSHGRAKRSEEATRPETECDAPIPAPRLSRSVPSESDSHTPSAVMVNCNLPADCETSAMPPELLQSDKKVTIVEESEQETKEEGMSTKEEMKMEKKRERPSVRSLNQAFTLESKKRGIRPVSAQSRYLGCLRILDSPRGPENPSDLTNGDTIRAAFYQEWLHKKRAVFQTQAKEKWQQEKLNMEEKKQVEQEKKLEADLSFSAWKKNKKVYLQEQVHRRKEEEREECEAQRKKSENKDAARETFQAWKGEKDRRLKNLQRTARVQEQERKGKEDREKAVRMEEKIIAYEKWKKKKMGILNQQKESIELAKRKEAEDEIVKEVKEKQAQNEYEAWLEKKERQERLTRKLNKSRSLLELGSSAWVPAGRLIPRGK
uniref:Microtubule-associated protein 9 n=1 Tax=Eptatretus burgeri TaxID=7764 RepID=A0A8C4PWP2_EPTBU